MIREKQKEKERGGGLTFLAEFFNKPFFSAVMGTQVGERHPYSWVTLRQTTQNRTMSLHARHEVIPSLSPIGRGWMAVLQQREREGERKVRLVVVVGRGIRGQKKGPPLRQYLVGFARASNKACNSPLCFSELICLEYLVMSSKVISPWQFRQGGSWCFLLTRTVSR